MRKINKTVLLGAALACGSACAQAPSGAPGCSAVIDQAAWIAGRWVGEGMGGLVEETWAPPLGCQMVGHFRLVVDGNPLVYETMMIDVAEGRLRLRVKHFTREFVGWEERDAWRTFKFVHASPDELSFDGLVIRRSGVDQIDIVVTLGRNGRVHDERLPMRRDPL